MLTYCTVKVSVLAKDGRILSRIHFYTDHNGNDAFAE